jgi:2-polyprenyl-3-methyl-5-hydroxy-6-metoxy-1,4-benzoquinol methylase
MNTFYRTALKTLLRIGDTLDWAIDRTALRYGGGLHPKHRLMNYHQFFVGRIKATESVLDLGCGMGAVAYSVASQTGAKVIGIDFNAANIASARKRYTHPNLTYMVGDALKDLPTTGFDVIVFSNVLEHLDNRVPFLKTAQERLRAKRWLIRVPMFNRDWRVPLRKELGLSYFNDPTHYIEYTREIFEEELTAAGFEITDVTVNWGEIWAEARPSKTANVP